MHRYEELEKLYYKKKKIFYFTIVMSVLLIGSAVFFAINKLSSTQNVNKKNKTVSVKKVTPKKKVKKEENKTVKREIIKPVTETKPKEKKEFKLEFILPNIAEVKVPKEKHAKKIKKASEKPVLKPKPKKIANNLEVVEIPDVKLHVQKVDINKLIKSFNSSPNYDLALNISKEYLKINDIKNAQKWALKANVMEPERVDSWIQFADILLKQGKKEKARQILRVYIDSYGENEEINRKLRSINE